MRRGLAIGAALSGLGWNVTLANTASAEIALGDGAGDIGTLSGLGSGERGTGGRGSDGLDPASLRPNFDACVIDSYKATPELRRALAPYLAIDDYYLPLPGAIAVLNPAPGADAAQYQIDEKLLGPRYALLGGDVLLARESCEEPEFPPRRVYVWLGAAGTTELAGIVKSTLAGLLPAAEVIFPPAHANPIQPQAGPAETQVSFNGGARYIAMADMVVCAGGVTALEAACIGRPTVALALAENQLANVAGLAGEGTLVAATDSTLGQVVSELLSDREKFLGLGSRGRKLVDGLGAERAAEAIGRIFSEPAGGSPHLD
ncbi:MAG: hypothetical protein DCC49_04420 [Acidobacteria bacterium]|nr:MAG: hypothetical protein DCC49_04420 [Acidobacteriota bacterium]